MGLIGGLAWGVGSILTNTPVEPAWLPWAICGIGFLMVLTVSKTR